MCNLIPYQRFFGQCFLKWTHYSSPQNLCSLASSTINTLSFTFTICLKPLLPFNLCVIIFSSSSPPPHCRLPLVMDCQDVLQQRLRDNNKGPLNNFCQWIAPCFVQWVFFPSKICSWSFLGSQSMTSKTSLLNVIWKVILLNIGAYVRPQNLIIAKYCLLYQTNGNV